METSFTINGMKCAGCVSIVEEKVAQIQGVTQVTVDLDAKTATIISDIPVAAAQVDAALVDTKFQVAD